jgi:predicted HTH transcriptional regulator
MIAEYGSMVDFRPTHQASLDLRELRDIVRKGEGQHTEFKLKSNHPEKIVREAVAFANSQGGRLIIGIGDDKSIKGLKFADEDEFILRRAIERHIYPAIDYDIERLSVENEREVLIFNIERSPFKPHYLDLDGNPDNRRVYVRVNDKAVQASKEVREILKGERKAQNIRFQYGEKERILMKYLGDNQHITVDIFAEIANIPRKIASKTLVLLVLANVLKIQPSDNSDLFMAA